MRLKEGMAKDSTDKMAIVTYESLIEKVSDGNHYNFANVRVQIYLDERVLKTTLMSDSHLPKRFFNLLQWQPL